ncbi:MAG: hypothetical protein EXR79_02525 [Myxococcales bacterium]|nr:hypothetical protein [Myxococcales bacterium]
MQPVFSPQLDNALGRALRCACLLALLTASACASQTTGDLGNLRFWYLADDKIADFNKAIAVGARIDLHVATATTPEQLVTVLAATSDKPEALKIVEFKGDVVTLEGTGDGPATIDVKGKKANAQEVPDKVHMRAAKVQKTALRHTCTADPEGLYLVNQDIYVPFDLKHANNEPAIGYGYRPFTNEPAGVLTLDTASKDQQFLHFTTAAAKGVATLKSTVDATTASVKLVDIDDVDGAALGGTYFVAVGLLEVPVLVRPTIGGKPVCQAKTEVKATTTTPDTCSVKVLGSTAVGASAATADTYGLVKVKGLKAGKCTLAVEFSKAKGGAGVKAELSVDVGPPVKPAGS